MNTPPDDMGGERSPIALDRVPSPIETQSDATGPAVGSDQLPTEPICDAPRKRLQSKAAYRARRSADGAFLEASERQRARE